MVLPFVVQGATVPWSEDFDSASSAAAFSVIDANGDGETWEYNGDLGCMRVRFNSSRAMDDWLVSPSLTLRGGGTYRFSVDARRYGLGTERLEVFVGDAAQVSAMTIPVIGRTLVKTEKYSTYTGEFTVPSTGDWYIGVHGCSDADQLYLEVDNLRLVSGIEQSSPCAVSNLVVTPDAGGYLRALVSCDMPVSCVDGSELTVVDEVEILRDGRQVALLAGASAGAHMEWLDEDVSAGTHTYMVVVYSGGARGAEAEAIAFVGQKKPAMVTGLKARESEPGVVRLTWDVPRAEDGSLLNADLVRYRVVQNVPFQESLFTEEDIEGAESLSECEFTHTAVAATDGQLYTSYGVYAITSGGESRAARLPLFPVGEAYGVPYVESFAGGQKSSLMRSETVRYSQIAGSWDVYADGALADVPVQDADGGMVVMSGYSSGDCARLYSGKISLPSNGAQALTFYVYKDVTAADTNHLEVYVNDNGAGFSFAKELEVGRLASPGWNKVIVPLTSMSGHDVEFALQGTVGNHLFTAVDNIRVGNVYDTDMTAMSVEMPTAVMAGSDYEVTARVLNSGLREATGYDVVLLCDGQEQGRRQGPELASGDTYACTFSCDAHILDSGERSYAVRVEMAGDDNEDDNLSAGVVMHILAPALPAPSALEASQRDGVVSLQWQSPDLTQLKPDAVTESFETYEPFAQEGIGDWTMIDVDGNQNGKFADVTFPGINDNAAGGQHSAFWVLDSDSEGLNTSFASHDGHQCLVQMFNYGDAPCDDWAISPSLYPDGQSVSLFARSYSSYPSFAETMQILVSESDSTDPADFRVIATETVPSAWTQYIYTLDAGVRRMAIRCLSEGCYMLMVDDVTYIPATGTSSAILTGYNLYRDRVAIASLGSEDQDDTDAPMVGKHSYAVTAVYDCGESGGCLLDVDVESGINGVPVSDSYTVVSAAGVILFREGLRSDLERLPAGLYVINGQKVLVR